MEETKLLRPYQTEFINNVLSEFNRHGHQRVIGVAPCGSGKTVMATEIVRQYVEQGKRVLFFVHVHELIEQTSHTFSNNGIKHSVLEGGRIYDPDHSEVTIASIQTLVRRLSKIQRPDLIICDEAHHILANSYMKTIQEFSKSQLLGLTATPERTGGIRLGDVFTSMVKTPGVAQLIEMGYLSKFNYYAPKKEDLDLSKVRVIAGDYDTSGLENLMVNPRIVGGILDHYMKVIPNRPTLVYCVNRRHSEFMANWFRDNGVCAVHLDCATPKNEREQIVHDFRKGYIKVLCNVNLFGEGFDSPGMEAVILARPTCSLIKHIQQSMRALRIDPENPNKVATILDHVGNYAKFGIPTTEHLWSLDPNDERPVPVKKCPSCGLVVPIYVEECPQCGLHFEMPKKEEEEPVLVEEMEAEGAAENMVESKGQLSLLFDAEDSVLPLSTTGSIIKAPEGIEELFRISEQRGYSKAWVAINALVTAKSFEEVQGIAMACKYKSGWAFYKWRALEQILNEGRDPRLYKKELAQA